MRKLLPNKPADPLGLDKEDIYILNGILTLTSLSGLLGSDQKGCQNGETRHFSAAKPQVWMQRQRTMDMNMKYQNMTIEEKIY